MTETITCPADIPAGLSRLRGQDSHRGLDRSRGGHYDVYEGGLDHDNVLRVETEFLLRCSPAATSSAP